MNLMHEPPETRYADTGDGFVAYQQFGKGPIDVVYTHSMDSNAVAMWDHPSVARYFERLGSFSRVLYFDARGSGASDPVPMAKLPTFDSWADDIRFAMDAAGVERAVLIGDAEGGPMAMMFAATHPERVSALVLVNAYARFLRASDYPIGMPRESAQRLVSHLRRLRGSSEYFRGSLPGSIDDPGVAAWLARYQLLAATPSVFAPIFEHYLELDVRSVLPTITVPTLVIIRVDARYHRPAFGRYLAEHIPESRLVELPGADTAPFFLADPEPVLDEIEEFLTGERAPPTPDRRLATVLFTDIVDSTGHAARLGDEAWMRVLEAHGRLTRQYLARYEGAEVADTGDGFVATFDGPTRAVTCAAELRGAVSHLGVEIRAGLHTGEVELRSDNIGGMTVHIAARVAAARAESDVTVSRTVADLVIGSGIGFESVGSYALKGVPGEWELFRVESLA